MLKLLKSASPEDLFVQRYDQLLRWALSLTNHNQEQAEDLVHDAFIQFTHRRGDLAAIENTDAYLNRMLRNMYLSQVRRAGLIQDSRFSIADFDSVEMGLKTFRANDPREHLDLQDDLRQVCQYACARKQTSKVGSVLILRFFHGYYPSEIVQVLRTTRMAIDRYLQISRREAKTYLVDPSALKFMSESRSLSRPASGYARTTPELLSELRQNIFSAREGDCLSSTELKDRYRGTTSIDGSLLSHVVSCPHCLDTVNQLLGLPLLAERSSDDRLGRDVPPDKSGGGGEGGTGGSIVEPKKKYQRRLKEVMEHRPQELRVAVNGFVLGAQQVNSELSKLALTVNVDEAVGFIEVFSEQGVRLLFFDVDQPTAGSIEQCAGVDFDCGRALDLSLSFRGPWPAVNLTYHDPTFDAIESYVERRESEVQTSDEVGGVRPSSQIIYNDAVLAEVTAAETIAIPEMVAVGEQGIESVPPAVRQHRAGRRVAGGVLMAFIDSAKGFTFRSIFQPVRLASVLAAMLIATLLVIKFFPPGTVSAAELLMKSAAAEDARLANKNRVLHRTLDLEEYRNGQTASRKKIEIWQSAEKGITARRLYDEQGQLTSGDWRSMNGVQTIYQRGEAAKLQPLPESRAKSISFNDAWQLSITAKEFQRLLDQTDQAQVETRANDYLITCMALTNTNGIIKAAIVLSKEDLHATEQTFTLKNADEIREYRMVETSYEWKPANVVAPTVFEPNVELTGGKPVPPAIAGGDPVSEPGAAVATGALPANATNAVTAGATLETEVEVFKLLDAINALSGEQISVTRVNGQLKVSGVVDSAQRKTEIMNALAPVKNGRGVVVEIETAEESASRKKKSQTTDNISIESVTVATDQSLPVETELRTLLSRRRVAPERMEEEMRAFSNTVTASSRVLRRNALALKQIAERFTPAEVDRLEPAKREEWKALVRSRARAVAGDVKTLTGQLQPAFPGMQIGAGGAGDVKDASDAAPAAQRLFGLAAACDSQVSQSFAISSGGKGAAPVRSVQFWRSLAQMAGLAAELQGF